MNNGDTLVRRVDFVAGRAGGSFRWVAFINEDASGAGRFVVGLCDGNYCQTCDGLPEGFDGGVLQVDLHKMDRATVFFIAHTVAAPESEESLTPPYWLLVRVDGVVPKSQAERWKVPQ